MALQTITTTGIITNCVPSRWGGMQALFTDAQGQRHILTVAKGVGTKGIKSSKKNPGAPMTPVRVTYTVNETTETKQLIGYEILPK